MSEKAVDKEKFVRNINKRGIVKYFTPYGPINKKDVYLRYGAPPTCPKCGVKLDVFSQKPHWFPYIHTDFTMFCSECGTMFVFGIPQSRDIGLALIVFDSNPVEVVKLFDKAGERDCPFGHGRMNKTKVFGDWIPPDAEKVELQWKCPECFLTAHEMFDRECEHGEDDGTVLSEDEQKNLRKRLEALGYLEPTV